MALRGGAEVGAVALAAVAGGRAVRRKGDLRGALGHWETGQATSAGLHRSARDGGEWLARMSRGGGGGGGGVRRRRAAGYGGGARALEMNSPPQSKMISSCSLASAQEYALEALELLTYEGERGVAAACCAAAATTSNRGSSIAARKTRAVFGKLRLGSFPALVSFPARARPHPGGRAPTNGRSPEPGIAFPVSVGATTRDEGKVGTARCHWSARRAAHNAG